MTKVEIKPGPELDRAVAKACDPWCSVGMCASLGCIDIPASLTGGTAQTDPDVLAVWKWDGERNWRTLPKFSTDLNAAFAAAEKAGLFDDYVLAKESAKSWCLMLWCNEPPIDADVLAFSGMTPALAICAAILKLKEESHGV